LFRNSKQNNLGNGGIKLESIGLIGFAHIDRQATRKRVEGVLETVRMYGLIGLQRRQSKVVSGYESHSHGGTNQLNKQVAIYNVDMEERLRNLYGEVEEAIKCLDENEQEMIRRRYLQRDKEFDFMLHHELNLSERTYRRMKARAIAKLAYMLRLEVMRS
jgi:ArpU family phage transcriptional regulator